MTELHYFFLLCALTAGESVQSMRKVLKCRERGSPRGTGNTPKLNAAKNSRVRPPQITVPQTQGVFFGVSFAAAALEYLTKSIQGGT